MAQDISTEDIKVDFKYFINSALQNKITWEALYHFLNDLTPSLTTSNKVIKILLKELQRIQNIQMERANDEVQAA